MKSLSAILQAEKTILSKQKHTNRFAQKTVNKLVLTLGAKNSAKSTRSRKLKSQTMPCLKTFTTLYQSKSGSRASHMKAYLQNYDSFYQNQRALLRGTTTALGDGTTIQKVDTFDLTGLNNELGDTLKYKNHSGRKFSLFSNLTKDSHDFEKMSSSQKIQQHYPFQQIYLKQIDLTSQKNQFKFPAIVKLSSKKLKKAKKTETCLYVKIYY